MATNSQLLGMFLRGQALDEGQIQQLERAMSQFDETARKSGDWSFGTDPKFRELRAQTAVFDVTPLSLLNLESPINQSLTNSDYTVLSAQSAPTAGLPVFFTWDAADPTKIKVGGNFHQRGILACGALDFEANATGRRGVKLDGFDASDAAVETVVMAQLPASGSGDTILPFSTVLILPSTTVYLKVSAYQNSGGVLNLSAYNISFMVVK